MQQKIVQIALVVDDYDAAIAFYTEQLDFVVTEDTVIPEQNKRWVTLQPPGSPETALLLARASDDTQRAAVGNQSGGRVFLFLQTDDFWRDYQNYRERGVVFVRDPVEQPYGTVAVFEDLYGNRWDLIEYRQKA